MHFARNCGHHQQQHIRQLAGIQQPSPINLHQSTFTNWCVAISLRNQSMMMSTAVCAKASTSPLSSLSILKIEEHTTNTANNSQRNSPDHEISTFVLNMFVNFG